MRILTSVKLILLALFLMTMVDSNAQNNATAITYVNVMASGANNGTSWADAYNDLQTALNDPQASEIWVAQGIYSPFDSRLPYFFIDGFGATGYVYGGFNGDETKLEQRNSNTNITVLERSRQIETENTILNSSSKSNDIIFDGFTISTVVTPKASMLNGEIINTQIVNSYYGNLPINNSSEFLSKSPKTNNLKSFSFSADELDTSTEDSDPLTNNFSVFPTITSTNITVQSSTPAKVEIINYLGKTVKKILIANSPLSIDLSALSKGIYIVKIFCVKNGVSTTRIVIQ